MTMTRALDGALTELRRQGVRPMLERHVAAVRAKAIS